MFTFLVCFVLFILYFRCSATFAFCTVFEVLAKLSPSGINHTVRETMKPALVTQPVKRSAVYYLREAALPVNNKALRRCSWRSLCSYKYGTCHCYDYFKPSAVTRHCLLPACACFCVCRGAPQFIKVR